MLLLEQGWSNAGAMKLDAYQCCETAETNDVLCLSLGLADPCNPNPCQNGGQCTAVDGKPICSCPEQYEGDYCEKPKGKR